MKGQIFQDLAKKFILPVTGSAPVFIVNFVSYPDPTKKVPLIFVVGPTATGKSDLALEVFEGLHGSIVNGDSLQVFQRLNIGTAKPTLEERARIPHFLFDICSPGSLFTAGDFRREVLKVFEESKSRPMSLVGGSGFYLQALVQGLFELPKPDPGVQLKVREDLTLLGLPRLYQELFERDPQYAKRVPAQDTYRVCRAVEILRSQSKLLTELWKEHQPPELPFLPVMIGVLRPRDILRRRIEQRVERMFASGFVEEVEGLVRDGFASWAPLRSVGYKEVLEMLKGERGLEETKELIRIHTWQLAKRQMTWFRRDKTIEWFDLESEGDLARAQIRAQFQ